MHRYLPFIAPGLGLIILLLAWVPAHKIWQWKLSLVSLEFGHWAALVIVASTLLFWKVTGGWLRWLSVSLIIAHLAPAFLAAQKTPSFQWSRLWMPWAFQHAEIRVSKEDYWQDLDLVIYHPPATNTPTPWVLVLHTGGWDSGTNTEFEACHRELASHGVAVIAMSYRLAPKHPWPAQKEDVRRAVDYVRSRATALNLDPDQLYLMGRSAGGQIASACGYTMPELHAKGCIMIYSPMDLVFARKYAFSDDILNSLLLLRQYLGGDPEEAPDNYRSASAIEHVTADSPRTLMVHGTRDTMVWVKQSQRHMARLQTTGGDHEFLELPWAIHACDHFPSTPGGQATMQALVKFLSR